MWCVPSFGYAKWRRRMRTWPPCGRGVPIAQVRDGMGQGRVLGADAAMAQNMVDGVTTFDDVVRKMHRDAKVSAKSSRASRLVQARHLLSIS